MKQLIKSFSIYTSVSILTGSISFLLLPVLTSYLSPEDYGLLSIFNASIRFVSAFIGLGMSHVLLVDLIKSRNVFVYRLKGFGIATISICLLFTIAGFLYYLFSSSFFGIPTTFALFIPLISLMVVYFEFFTSIMIFLKQAKKFAIYSLSKFGIETILTILFVVIFGMNWVGRIMSLAIALILIIILLLFYLFTEFELKQKVYNIKKHAIELLKEGWALLLMSVSFMVINLSDRFFIENFQGISETGKYSVAATIAGIMFMVIGALMKVIRPMIYEMLNDKLNSKLNKIGLFYHMILLIFSLILIFVTPLIFKYFIDSSFKEAQEFSFLLVVGLFFWGGYSYFLSFILYYKKHRMNSVLALAAIFLNLVLNYLFIKEVGTKGAAYATLITYVCMFVFSILISFRINANIKQIA